MLPPLPALAQEIRAAMANLALRALGLALTAHHTTSEELSQELKRQKEDESLQNAGDSSGVSKGPQQVTHKAHPPPAMLPAASPGLPRRSSRVAGMLTSAQLLSG